MVMISPCAGCDSSTLAHILGFVQGILGTLTILRSGWLYWIFRIPLQKLSADEEEQKPAEIEGLEIINLETTTNEDCIPQTIDDSSVFANESKRNNIMWTIVGTFIGGLNIALASFLLFSLSSVNYVFLLGWCLSFPLAYLLDCVLFTLLLKHCTSKDRFDSCKSYYVSSTIGSFVFNSYVLWVAISVLHWCNCRKDPYHCRFQRDYCHSFNLSFGAKIYDYADYFNQSESYRM